MEKQKGGNDESVEECCALLDILSSEGTGLKMIVIVNFLKKV